MLGFEEQISADGLLAPGDLCSHNTVPFCATATARLSATIGEGRIVIQCVVDC